MVGGTEVLLGPTDTTNKMLWYMSAKLPSNISPNTLKVICKLPNHMTTIQEVRLGPPPPSKYIIVGGEGGVTTCCQRVHSDFLVTKDKDHMQNFITLGEPLQGDKLLDHKSRRICAMLLRVCEII